jgi:integrin beta 3
MDRIIASMQGLERRLTAKFETDVQAARADYAERIKQSGMAFDALMLRVDALGVELAAAKSASLDVRPLMAEWSAAVKSLQPIAGPPGPAGPPGVGIQGERGERGERGESITGPAGKDGVGLAGKDGRDGIDGKDGVGLQGKDGRDGIDGKDGVGLQGKDGRDGIDGKDGVGIVGPEGRAGIDGLHGKDGRDGISVVGGVITRQGTLQLTFSDGQTKDAGLVAPDPEWVRQAVADQMKSWPRPKDGAPGAPGAPGRDGTLEDARADFDGKRTITLYRKDGSVLGQWDIPIPTDEGVFKLGTLYRKGAGVTHGGSFWIAQEDTRDRPGESKAWRMAVRRGSDGKDGKDGKDGD